MNKKPKARPSFSYPNSLNCRLVHLEYALQYNHSSAFPVYTRYRFDTRVKKEGGDKYYKHFKSWQQFLTCLYAQITGKESLRNVCNGLLTNHNKLYHLGLYPIAKSILADA